MLPNIPVAVGACLRKIILERVETYAVETVQVWKNTSVLHDEFIASRLALCPIRAQHPCTGRLFARNIERTGMMNVTCRHIILDDDTVECIYPDIVLAKLAPGQTLEATFNIVRGCGGTHTKFCPVSVCTLQTNAEFEKASNGNFFPEDERVDLEVETIGQFSNTDIIKRAIEELQSDLRTICPART